MTLKTFLTTVMGYDEAAANLVVRKNIKHMREIMNESTPLSVSALDHALRKVGIVKVSPTKRSDCSRGVDILLDNKVSLTFAWDDPYGICTYGEKEVACPSEEDHRNTMIQQIKKKLTPEEIELLRL